MFRLQHSTDIVAHEWRGVNKEHPIIRTRLGNVVWYVWGGFLVRVERLDHANVTSESWFLESAAINMNAMFPNYRGNRERLSLDDLYLKLAALIAQDIGPRLELHMNKVLLGE